MFEQIPDGRRLYISPSPVMGDGSDLVTDDRATLVPIVAPSLIAFNVLVFLYMMAHGVSPLNPTPWQVIPCGANVGPFTMSGQ